MRPKISLFFFFFLVSKRELIRVGGEEERKEEEKRRRRRRRGQESYGTLWNLYGTRILYGNFENGIICMDFSSSISRV